MFLRNFLNDISTKMLQDNLLVWLRKKEIYQKWRIVDDVAKREGPAPRHHVPLPSVAACVSWREDVPVSLSGKSLHFHAIRLSIEKNYYCFVEDELLRSFRIDFQFKWCREESRVIPNPSNVSFLLLFYFYFVSTDDVILSRSSRLSTPIVSLWSILSLLSILTDW